MRKYIITKEFNGNLEIGDEKIENVKCIYEDDYYSNNIMRGRIVILDDLMNITLLNEPFKDFSFTDINGRILKGSINGWSLQNEYNSRWHELTFKLREYSQWMRWSDKNISSIKLKYSIPYIRDLSRGLQYSHDLYPEWLFKFRRKPFKLILNGQEFVFDEHVYCYNYKKPDSILARELFIIVSIPYENNDISELLNNYESQIDETMLLVSFIFNHRMRSYSFYAELLDENGKLVETVEHKESIKLCGSDYLKDTDHKFKQLLNSENLSKLIENFIVKEPDEKMTISILIHKFLTIGETEIFEPKFLSGYFLLVSVSKLIVEPKEHFSDESLIKNAVCKSKVEMEKFKTSHNREKNNNSKAEWEITEYRNYLSHFNYQDNYDTKLMYEEYIKIERLSRRLILWIICPELSNWTLPN